MKILPFTTSREVSIGVELEIQIIHPRTYALVSRAKDLIRHIKRSAYDTRIKPEITQSMLEINSSIHTSANDLMDELHDIQNFLLLQAQELGVAFCGGGTHPFHKWMLQKIFPTLRYKKLSRLFRYLSKRSTLFGQHVHIGCASANEALYLTHAMARYVPHFIALSASSPFYQGVDTGFESTRSTMFTGFPSSGLIPYLVTWEEFSNYFYQLKNLGMVQSMKDFYWDVRPKPEFGTVEIRVCDTPLTIKRAVIIAAYMQALSLYLMHEKPVDITHNLYYLYGYNRFQASRFGFAGHIIDHQDLQPYTIEEDILATIKKIERYGNQLNNMGMISQLFDLVINKKNDSVILRNLHKQLSSFPKVVSKQCEMWKDGEK